LTKLLTILIALTILSSCDCYQLVNGTVIDKKTGKPLQGVTVFNKNKDWIKTTTDKTGYFELSNVTSGFGCPPMTIVVETTDYKRTETTIPAGGQEIVKIEKEISCIPQPDLLDNQPVYLDVDKKAIFAGGHSAFLNYLSENLRYPKEQEEWQGSIYVTFVVDTLGTIRNECIYKSYFKGENSPLEKVALKLIKEMPPWTPAEKNGKKVYSRVNLPIRF
jgi:protein TonB